MFVITNLIQLYGIKITTDLALRSGSPDARSYSRYNGMNGIINQNMKENEIVNIEYLMQEQSDFDADACQPHYTAEEYNEEEEKLEFEMGTCYNPSKDDLTFNDYFRRIEDIASPYLEKYLHNLVYRINKQSGAGGLKRAELNHPIQPTLYSGEDGDYTELADLQVAGNPNEWSQEAKNHAHTELPYVIKRLRNLSMLCGIHMLSMIASYVKAKEINISRNNNGAKHILKKNDVIAHCVYACDKQGNIGKKIEISNKNQKASDMFDWLEGINLAFPSYYVDYSNFVHYCRVLNIDLDEDMSKYDNKFVDSLVTLTLTPDTQYLPEVFQMISVKKTAVAEVTEDVITSTMDLFRSLIKVDDQLSAIVKQSDHLIVNHCMETAQKLHYMYSVVFEGHMPRGKYTTSNGFLYYDNELLVMPIHFITDSKYDYNDFIISELGFCMRTTNGMYLDTMTVDVALSNAIMKRSEKDEDDKLVPFKRYYT